MFEQLADWLAAILPDVAISNGPWVDHPAVYNSYICAVYGMGGPAVDVDDRRLRYRIVLLGPRNGRDKASRVAEHARDIVAAAIDGPSICGAAGVRGISDIVGPSYTEENRAWYQLEVQITA